MMKQLIEIIFGVYEPIKYNTVVGEIATSVVADGMAGVDWTYVLGVLGFFLVLYCVLRILGGVISKI